MNKILSILALLFISTISCQNCEKSNLTLLSNQIPTDTALIFGQGIISTDNFEFEIIFNSKMDELFFTRRKPKENNEIYTMKLVNGKWRYLLDRFHSDKKRTFREYKQ